MGESPGSHVTGEAVDDSGSPSARAGRRARVVVTPPTEWDKSSWRALVAVVREDRAANGHSVGQPVTQMMTIHRFGEWVYDPGRTGLWRLLGRPLYRACFVYVRNVLGFEIEHTVKMGRQVRFFHQHGVAMHPYTELGDGTHVYQGVTIGVRWEAGKPAAYYDRPRIGANVRLGTGCTLIGAISIGDGARVGAMTMVSRDVPEGASVIAPPPRVLRLH